MELVNKMYLKVERGQQTTDDRQLTIQKNIQTIKT